MASILGSFTVVSAGRKAFTIWWRSSCQGSSGPGARASRATKAGSRKSIGPPSPNIVAKPWFTHCRLDRRCSCGSTSLENEVSAGTGSAPEATKVSTSRSCMVRQPIMSGA